MKKLKKLVVGVLLFSMVLGMTVCAGPSRVGIVWCDFYDYYEGVTGDNQTVLMYPLLSEASQMADVATVKSLTGWDNFTIQFFDYKLYQREKHGLYKKDGTLGGSVGNPSELKEIESLGKPVMIPVRFSWVYEEEKEGAEIKVIVLNNGKWEVIASEQGSKIKTKEGTAIGVNAAFPIPASSAAFIVKTDGDTAINGSSSHSHSSSDDSGSGSSDTPYVNPVSIPNGGEVSFDSAGVSYNARLLAGPTTRTFSVTDAQTMLETANACSVYLMDIWLENRDNPGEVLTLGEEGAVLSFNVPNVNPNCRVKIRHWLNGTDEYEDLTPVEIGNGYIRVKFTSLSPIAICVEEAPAPAQGTAPVSPKTGEGSMIYVAELMAAAALLGYAVYRKKRAER